MSRTPVGRTIEREGGGCTIRLPNGTTLSLEEWLTGDLYSAMIVDPRAEKTAFRLFDYGRGELIPGADTPGDLSLTPLTSAVKGFPSATTAHTNMPRSSASGLPQDWEVFVTHWSARLSCPLSDDVAAWAAETSVEFVYNCKSYGALSLIELLHGRVAIGDPFPLWMREHIDWHVDVTSSKEAMERMRRSRAGLDDRLADALRDLQSIITAYPDHASSKIAAAAYGRIKAMRPFTVWVHLEGALKRAVM